MEFSHSVMRSLFCFRYRFKSSICRRASKSRAFLFIFSPSFTQWQFSAFFWRPRCVSAPTACANIFPFLFFLDSTFYSLFPRSLSSAFLFSLQKGRKSQAAKWTFIETEYKVSFFEAYSAPNSMKTWIPSLSGWCLLSSKQTTWEKAF